MQSGLDVNEVSRRLERYGRNQLPQGRKRGPFMRVLTQFNNILIYVLLAAGFVKLMVGLWLDAVIILGVVVLNALLGFIQEGKAEKTLDSIRQMLSAEARTLRGEEVRMSQRRGWFLATSCSSNPVTRFPQTFASSK
jgi:magnesium-transporting ATPase (P-type)